MASFPLLPTELLLKVFELLHCLDDAACLAWTSTILWSIIRKSDYHKYDHSLCLLHDKMYGAEESSACRLPTEPLQQIDAWMLGDYSKVDLDDQPQDTSKRITGRHLRSILGWWQQTSLLRQIYLDISEDYRSVLSFVDLESMTREQKPKYALALHLDQKFVITGKLSRQGSGRPVPVVAKGEFYRAVMARFLDTKMLQFATLCRSSKSSNELHRNVLSMWSDNPTRTLEESVQVLEVFDFVSNFMLLHILQDPDTLLDWVESSGRSDVLILDHDDTPLWNWMYCLSRLQPYLSPFDILAAFPMDTLDHESLQVDKIENEVSCKLEKYHNVAGDVWERYRYHGWRNGVRGVSFNEDFGGRGFASEVTGFNGHGRNWWELMKQTRDTVHVPRGFKFSVPSLYLMRDCTHAEDIDGNHLNFIITDNDLSQLDFE
ncbi:hypothetical protein BDQ94DRAFT_185534 [Aspergillus welwitschiae]|uniref:F-box domain-containing protein n=1 Tax=Aspergillus welwitschiae TaxID=1341132 RepID=A0A3F3PJL5_9EURO|nr:hypothetical protein BDQ94DRAFT_185534 [Aspergillus welwitschiae]RDH27078.1 hypothetical protein BDQ94DRAFT_185534 [Aspergillus welwitschiae]